MRGAESEVEYSELLALRMNSETKLSGCIAAFAKSCTGADIYLDLLSGRSSLLQCHETTASHHLLQKRLCLH